ncbi:MAG: hypothetical protein ACR2NZ_13170 [Rubripirellula sp.]
MNAPSTSGVSDADSKAESDVWVAVGYGGRRMTSTDGLNWKITAEWSQPGKDDSNNLMGLVYAMNIFVAVGGGGGGKTAGGHVLISEDGREWRETWKAPSRINPVVFGQQRFVVGGPKRQLYWSADGELWNQGAVLTDKRCTHFRQGAFGNGRFVITGNHGGQSEAWIAVTSDGESIEHITFDIPNIRGLAFANKKFVVVGKGTRSVSTDGQHWMSTGANPEDHLTWVIHDGTQFLCGGGSSTHSSVDGVTWQTDTRKFRGSPKWTDGTRVISTSWPGKMFFSSDGAATWQQASEMTANGINRVARGQRP